MTTFIKLSQPQQGRLGRLLHMEYTLHELAEEIGCDVRTLRRACEAGCPHRLAGTRVYIVGDAFREWYEALCASRRTTLSADEAWCLRCRKAVALTGNLIVTALPHGVERVEGRCPVCGVVINRMRRVL